MSKDNPDRLYSSGEWFEHPEGGGPNEWVPSDPPPELVNENALIGVLYEQHKKIEMLEKRLQTLI